MGTAKGGVPKKAMRAGPSLPGPRTGAARPCSPIIRPIEPRTLARHQRAQRRPALIPVVPRRQDRLEGGELLMLAPAERIHRRVELGEDVPQLVVAPQRSPAREASVGQPPELSAEHPHR